MHDRDGVEALLDRTKGLMGVGDRHCDVVPRLSTAGRQSCSCPHRHSLIHESDGAGQVPQDE